MKFSGTTAECLVEYGRLYPGTANRKLMARFCQVEDHPTARSWVKGDRVPTGEALLRVRCFLHLAGFKVSEFDEHPLVARRLALLIAFDALTLNAVQTVLKYEKRGGVFTLLLRGGSPMRDRAFRMERLVEQHEKELKRLTNSWRHEIAQELGSDAQSSSTQPLTDPEPEAEKPQEEQFDWQPPADTPSPDPQQPAEVAFQPPPRTLPTRLTPQPPFKRSEGVASSLERVLPPPVPEQSSSRRTRTRGRSTVAQLGKVALADGIEERTPQQIEAAKVLMHLTHTFGMLLDNVQPADRSAVATLLGARVGSNRLKDIRDFLDSAIGD